MDAITVIALLGTRLGQVQIDDLEKVVTMFYNVSVYVNKRRGHQDAKVANFP